MSMRGGGRSRGLEEVKEGESLRPGCTSVNPVHISAMVSIPQELPERPGRDAC